MKSIRPATLLLALFVSLASFGLLAHHSTNGLYDENEIVELTGKVREWRFINPHPSLVIEVTGADGQPQEWDVSFGGPAVTHLKRQGYTAETFRPGDIIVVRGYAAKVETAHGMLILGDPTHEDGSPVVASPGRD